MVRTITQQTVKPDNRKRFGISPPFRAYDICIRTLSSKTRSKRVEFPPNTLILKEILRKATDCPLVSGFKTLDSQAHFHPENPGYLVDLKGLNRIKGRIQ